MLIVVSFQGDLMARKLILDCDNTIWKDVLRFKIDNELKNNNEAVNVLIRKGLFHYKGGVRR